MKTVGRIEEKNELSYNFKSVTKWNNETDQIDMINKTEVKIT